MKEKHNYSSICT